MHCTDHMHVCDVNTYDIDVACAGQIQMWLVCCNFEYYNYQCRRPRIRGSDIDDVFKFCIDGVCLTHTQTSDLMKPVANTG